jgi:Flp pilus assembly protein TadG
MTPSGQSSWWPRLRTTRGGERGGASAIEAVLIVPLIMVFASLIWAGYRITVAEDAVSQAAGAAARAATISRSAGEARSDARDVASSSLSTSGLECTSTSVDVDTSGFSVAVGQPASVRVSVSCRAPLEDLVVPGLSGSRLLQASATSPLDRFRTRR